MVSTPYVYFFEPISPPSEPENLPGKTLHRSNIIDHFSVGNTILDGAGVTLALGDDGIVGPHADYQGRTNQSNVSLNNGDHGDHIAGTIMGAGNINPSTKGMAPGSFLMVYQVWNAVNSSPSSYNTHSVRITNTSYSDGCNTGYTSFARTADIHINSNPALMHVFSAGNNGSSNCNYGAGAGWGNITGGIKVAKNTIAVGNLNEIDVLNSTSSRGPVHDGRIKPDICAMGTSVISTTDPHDYTSKTGTSMSAPGIAGVMAQLYQGYKLLNNGNDPNSALIKTAMMNTADDLGNPGPDFRHGYGRVNARRAYDLIKENRYMNASVSQGDSVSFTINVPPGVQEVRVMLYWHDKEALAGASSALVNNLDLQVVTPTNVTFLPWRLVSIPIVSLLNSNATRGEDTVNNVEQVTISTPVEGVYTIKVKGTSVPFGPQNFFVVYENRNADIKLTYPIGGETLTPGQPHTIRWDAIAGSYGITSLHYSINDGATWTAIAGAVIAANRHFTWMVPVSLDGKTIKIRIRRGTNSEDFSSGPVSIMRTPTGLQLDWACANDLKIKWNPVPFATGYIVYRLGAQYMDSIGYTSGTSYVVNNINSNSEQFFSVKAIGQNGLESNRAIALRKLSGTSGCIAPSAGLIAPDTACSATAIVFVDNSVGAAAQYNWEFGADATPSSAIGLGPHTVSFNTNGSKNVKLIVSNALGTDSISRAIWIDQSPSSDFSFVESATTREVFFTSLATSFDSLLWDFGDGNFSSQTSPFHTYAVDTLYTASLTAFGNNCPASVTSKQIDLLTVAGLSVTESSTFMLSPNPAHGIVYLHKNAELPVESIEILDTKGSIVARQMVSNLYQNILPIDISKISSGTYVLRIISADKKLC